MQNTFYENMKRRTLAAGLFLFALVFFPCSPSIALIAEKTELPPGVIVLSESYMPFEEAKAFCAEHGGRLPLVAGLSQWDGLTPPKENVNMEGFVDEGLAWDKVGLPSGSYWTGTLFLDEPNISWYFFENSDTGKLNIDISFNDEASGETDRVICVK